MIHSAKQDRGLKDLRPANTDDKYWERGQVTVKHPVIRQVHLIQSSLQIITRFYPAISIKCYECFLPECCPRDKLL